MRNEILTGDVRQRDCDELIHVVSPYVDIRDDDPVCALDRRIDARILVSRLEDQRDRMVIEMRYENEMTLEQVAAVFDVPRERIRQIEMRAIRRLRNPRYA